MAGVLLCLVNFLVSTESIINLLLTSPYIFPTSSYNAHAIVKQNITVNECTAIAQKKGPVIHVAQHVRTSLRHTKETQPAVPAIHRGLCTATYTEFFLNQAESTLGKRLIPAFHKLVETMMRVLHTCTVYDETRVGDTPRTTGSLDACNNF